MNEWKHQNINLKHQCRALVMQTKIIIVKQISKTYKYVPGSAQIKFELKKTLFLLLC